MLEMISSYYLWIKAFHILSVIAWMAGLLYLPRLFAYHHQTIPGNEDFNRFCVMERRLLKIIMMPAMLSSYLFGVLLIAIVDPWFGGWFHVKLLMIFFLTGFHVHLAIWAKQFAKGEKPRSEKFFRAMNEIPFILAIIIVIMAVVKPF